MVNDLLFFFFCHKNGKAYNIETRKHTRYKDKETLYLYIYIYDI